MRRFNGFFAVLVIALLAGATSQVRATVVILQDDFNAATIDTTTKWDIASGIVQESADHTHAELIANGVPRLFAKTAFNKAPNDFSGQTLSMTYDLSGLVSNDNGYSGLNSALGGNNILIQ